jgi:TusA-related sulfurtransferase
LTGILYGDPKWFCTFTEILSDRTTMSETTQPDETLDVKGASCPMPVVRTKQAIDDLAAGEILEVLATDNGSVSDIDGWASGTPGVELLAQDERTEGGETVYVHHVRATDG